MTSYLIISFVVAFGATWQAQAQLSEAEVPAELQHLLHWDLDTWKPPADIANKYLYYLSGFDSENRPVWILEFGKWDIPAILDRGEKWEKALDKHIDQFLWRMYNSTGMRSDPKEPVKEANIIIDMEGYDLQQLNSVNAVAFVIRKVKSIVSALQFAYGAYIVNANFVAQMLIDILRPIIGRDFDKLQIFGTNPSSFRHVLLRHIPQDQLPKWYGGRKDFKPLWISSQG